MNTPRINLFGVDIDTLQMQQAVERLLEWTRSEARICRFVVTPNIDHVVMLQKDRRLRGAYAAASLVLADGWPVVKALRWLRGVPAERVAGSDLTPAVLAAATEARPLSVYLLGARPGVAERAAARIEARWPAVTVVGCYSPPLGFEHDAEENDRILDRIAEARPDLLIVGLGAPKQELWVHAHRAGIDVKAALCVGATIDFLAGEKRRAPRWMQRCGLEWLHRLATEPRRLCRRYAYDAWRFPQLVWREWRAA